MDPEALKKFNNYYNNYVTGFSLLQNGIEGFPARSLLSLMPRFSFDYT